MTPLSSGLLDNRHSTCLRKLGYVNIAMYFRWKRDIYWYETVGCLLSLLDGKRQLYMSLWNWFWWTSIMHGSGTCDVDMADHRNGFWTIIWPTCRASLYRKNLFVLYFDLLASKYLFSIWISELYMLTL